MSPMLMGFGQFDGCTTEQLMDYYEERAKGGTGGKREKGKYRSLHL